MSIRQAGYPDLPEIGRLLGAAFQADPVSTWLFPVAERRRAIQPLFFQAFAELALDSSGVIYLREDDLAMTVWFPGGEDTGDEEDFMARFDMLDDEETESFGRLAGAMAENHPDHGPHQHLQFIGVAPDRQREGLGAALLAHNLAILDKEGTSAYLEASSALSPPLYQRMGFEHVGTPYSPEAGPLMYPMWREPVS